MYKNTAESVQSPAPAVSMECQSFTGQTELIVLTLYKDKDPDKNGEHNRIWYFCFMLIHGERD